MTDRSESVGGYWGVNDHLFGGGDPFGKLPVLIVLRPGGDVLPHDQLAQTGFGGFGATILSISSR